LHYKLFEMQILLLFVLGQVQGFFASMDPAYLDFVKIIAGCVGWIGGLILYMWWKEKNKVQEPAMVRIAQNN
jgi:hypothetical protein